MNEGIQANQQTYSKSKRIASNTLLLFVRMFILTILNLYAVRWVLRGLGEEDYGIFNVVAGVVTVTSFISSVLALAIQRFYSIELGKNDFKRLNEIFSASMNIIFVSTIVVIIVFETIGIWFINTQLTIPPDRMFAAEWLFQFALFTFICSIIQIPYTAAVFSHEDMGIYALVSTMECLGRLITAYLIGIVLIDNLIYYGSGLLIVAVVVLFMYVFVGRKRYVECHYHKIKDHTLYKQLLFFSGWTTFGSISSTGMIQGGIILINIFFGPIANVAFGVALQINNAFTALTNSMVLPFRPAMIKAYAEARFDYVNQLFSVSNKFIIYILSAVSIPIAMEMKSVLIIWLGYINSNILLFSQLIIVYIVSMAMHNPITIIIHATGHIKEYHLPVESITLLCLPLTWVLFRIGLPSYSIFYAMIGVSIVAHVVRLFCLRRFYKEFSISKYLVNLVLPAILIITIDLFVTFFLHHSIENTIYRIAAVGCLSPLILFLLAYFIGINKGERDILKKIVKSITKNKLCHR